MGAALCSNSNKVVQEGALKATKTAGGQSSVKRTEANLKDKDCQPFNYSMTDKHYERLWRAVEKNDLFNTEKFLDFNEVDESNLYDTQG
jgi:hypothetical protein